MAESVVARPAGIPNGLGAALSALFVLPDRSGYFAILHPDVGLACPGCRRAMAFCIVTQHIDRAAAAGAASTWSYRCLACPDLPVAA
jgi:hypothetical protein